MPEIVRPAPDYRVELPDQDLLRRRFVFPNDAAYFARHSRQRVFRRCDQEFAVIGTDIESEEIEPFRYVRDLRFLGRQREAAFREERRHLCLRLFQHFLRLAGDHEVVGVPDQVHFGTGFSARKASGEFDPPARPAQCSPASARPRRLAASPLP